MSLQNLVGQTLDNKYLIERELGKGGMGAVYFATHIGTERPVAVKVIVPEYMERPEFVERFRREARAAGRLRHPNVVDVTDFGIADTTDGRVAYLVMEYLDGCTLGEVLTEEKNLPLGWTLDILEQVCSAVHEAHAQGIIHRDLKPDNIWLEPNQRGGYTVKVLDFGIAKLEAVHTGTHHGETNGDISTDSRGTHAGLQNITLGEGLQTHTFSGADAAATISQRPTVADKQDTQIQAAEAGTLIQPLAQVDSESGTVILPDTNKTKMPSDNDGTKLLSSVSSAEKADLLSKNSAELTRVGSVLGTPLYMSPEQCRGEKLDPRSDIYSLAVIAYQMLSGKTPFDGQFTEVMLAHQEKEPPKLQAKKTPRKVKRVIKQALAKTPEQRPTTAEAFVSKLRASAEGIGELLRKGLVIYSQHLLTFLFITLLISVPMMIVSLGKVGFNLSRALDFIEDSVWAIPVAVIVGISAFFLQIFTAAVLVGTITWIVAQILAVPLRPVSIKLATREVKSRWKPLILTTTASTLLTFVSWGVGAIAAALVSLIFALPIGYFFSDDLAAFIVGGSAILGAILFGLYFSARFMLIAPSVMIENIRGWAAFKRSAELVKRSLRTALAMAFLVYFVPGILALVIVITIQGFVRVYSPDDSKRTEAVETKKEDDPGFNISVKPSGVRVEEGERERKKLSPEEQNKLEKRQTLAGGIFELLWMPIAILISSFTSVITGLLYFKTRQAGGQSMNDLLEKFESADRPTSNWQKRLKNRLIQSGRQTSNPD